MSRVLILLLALVGVAGGAAAQSQQGPGPGPAPNVTSFQGRRGTVTLNQSDVTGVLGYTPAAPITAVPHEWVNGISSGGVPSLTQPAFTDLSGSLAASQMAAGAAAANLGYTPLNPANNLSDIGSAATARANLGIGSIATQAASSVTITGGTISGLSSLNVTGSGGLNGWGITLGVLDSSAGAPITAGSGYAVGDSLTLNDSCATHAVLTVSAVSSGAITQINVTNHGACAAAPSNPVSVLSTSGTGSGATFALGWGPLVAGLQIGTLTVNTGNLFLTDESPYANLAGAENTFVGDRAGGGITGASSQNFAGGHNACGIGTAPGAAVVNNTVCLGTDALRNITGSLTGDVFVGADAGHSAADPNNTVAVGPSAAYNLEAADYAVFIGAQAGYNATSPSSTTVIGGIAAYNLGAATGVTVAGYSALYSYAGSGYGLTVVGANAGYGMTGGSGNSIFGYQDAQTSDGGTGSAENAITTGAFNLELGMDAAVPSATVGGQLSIQNIIFGTGNTGFGIGAVSTGDIGIGQRAPAARLDILGTGVGAELALRVQSSAPSVLFSLSDSGVETHGAGAWTANGSVATSLTSLGPSSAHTAVQEWFTVTDAGGNVRYIPAF